MDDVLSVGASTTACRKQVNQRMMQQSESLTGLQQVMEERSVQLFNQEERIHQRDDLLTKVRPQIKPERRDVIQSNPLHIPE